MNTEVCSQKERYVVYTRSEGIAHHTAHTKVYQERSLRLDLVTAVTRGAVPIAPPTVISISLSLVGIAMVLAVIIYLMNTLDKLNLLC